MQVVCYGVLAMAVRKSCAFTGHRKIEDPPDFALMADIAEQLIARGVTDFYCGMARGFDLLAARFIVGMREKYPQIKLIACVSCPEQDRFFSAEDRRTYIELIDAADEVKVVNMRYFKAAMLRRNDYMVDHCQYLIAYMRNESGGTAYTVGYARSKKRKIFIV